MAVVTDCVRYSVPTVALASGSRVSIFFPISLIIFGVSCLYWSGPLRLVSPAGCSGHSDVGCSQQLGQSAVGVGQVCSYAYVGTPYREISFIVAFS